MPSHENNPIIVCCPSHKKIYLQIMKTEVAFQIEQLDYQKLPVLAEGRGRKGKEREVCAWDGGAAIGKANSIIFILSDCSLFKHIRQLMKPGIAVRLACLLLVLPALAASTFDLNNAGKTGGKLISTTCNIQTTLEFQFSSTSTIGTTGTPTNLAASTMQFLTAAGNDLKLTLSDATYDKAADALSFVLGYGKRLSTAVAPTVAAAFIFKFMATSGETVYVYIPVLTAASTNPDVVDLTTIGGALNTFALPNPLSAFNFLNQNNYNLWYTAVSGTTTVLVSNFAYRIASTSTALASPTQAATLAGFDWATAITSTGDKLCYASTVTTGNFQTHMRESVPLWFVWFWVFFFWLFYLCADTTNVKVYDNHYEDNRWTCSALYSLANLAHEECFTRLSRMTVMLSNWTIQGVIIACIYGNQFLGSPMIIWTAVIAFAVTLPVPILFGCLIHRKIYEKNLIKYENMRSMKGVSDKEKLEPLEQAIDTCEEKLYGYYHWFYAAALCLIFVCWPIAINQMQKLPRTLYHYHWYWLASMGIVFALQYFLFEPLAALLFGNTSVMRQRGGHFYNFKLGQAYRAAQTY